jgi:tetratricopeptide (TPR) repeat protein
VGKQAYPVIVTLLFLLPLFYFVALGMANSYYDRGLIQAREGKLQEADKSLATARRLTSSDDRMLIAHADLYRHALTLLPPDTDSGRKPLYQDALKFLERAQQTNPLRGLTFLIRGRLYQQNPALAGDNGYELAADSFHQALVLNPKMFQGRLDYAGLLLQLGRKQEALQTLDEGVKYEYYSLPELIPFYSLAARLRREAGRLEEAKELEEKAEQLEKQSKAGYSLRGY